jgi:hypothetical protein
MEKMVDLDRQGTAANWLAGLKFLWRLVFW